MFSLPGTPVLRYGDEIGMGDDSMPDAWACGRRCNGLRNLTAALLPRRSRSSRVISEGPFGYQHVNVAEQLRDPKSFLNWTERIVRMRKEIPEVGWVTSRFCRCTMRLSSGFVMTGAITR